MNNYMIDLIHSKVRDITERIAVKTALKEHSRIAVETVEN